MAERSVVIVRPAAPADQEAWLELRAALWPDGAEAEHREEIEQYLSGRSREPLRVLVAEGAAAELIGFVELSIRPCAEACRSSRVAYLEGWFVTPGARRRGVGRALVAAAEIWARERGCSEFASDAQPANTAGIAAHLAVGFEDAGLVRCFRKEL